MTRPRNPLTLLRQTSRPLRARAVAALGCAAVTAGVGTLAGSGVALITGGGLAIAYGLLLVDVDEPRRPR